MEFNDYQEKAWKTAIFFSKDLWRPALGIGEEAGELLGKIGKIYRGNNGVINNETKMNLVRGLGDLLWYMAALATTLEINFDDVAKENILKVSSRKERSTIQDSGEKR